MVVEGDSQRWDPEYLFLASKIGEGERQCGRPRDLRDGGGTFSLWIQGEGNQSMAVGEVLRSSRGLLGLIALSRPSRAPWSGDNASATLHMREAEPSSPDALNCITHTTLKTSASGAGLARSDANVNGNANALKKACMTCRVH